MIVWTEKAEKHWQKRYGKRNTKKAYVEAVFCNEPLEVCSNPNSLYMCFLERGWIFKTDTYCSDDNTKVLRWKFIQAKLRQGFNENDISKMLEKKQSSVYNWLRKNNYLSQKYGEIKWRKN